MPNTRIQHVVPEMHLKHWSDQKEQVYVFDCLKDSFFKTHIGNVCAIRDYHDFEGDIDMPFSIEEAFAEEIEGPADGPLKKIASLQTCLSDIEINNLCWYFGFQTGRTPFIHKRIDRVWIGLEIQKMISFLEDDEKYQDLVSMFREKFPDSEPPGRAELLRGIREGSISFKMENNNHNLSAMMMFGIRLAKQYRLRRWRLLVAGRGRGFVCNDNPIVTVTELFKKEKFTETIIPISPRSCLLIDQTGWKGSIEKVVVSPEMVREVNRRLAIHSDRFIIADNERLLLKIRELRTAEQEIVNKIVKNPSEPLVNSGFRLFSEMFD